MSKKPSTSKDESNTNVDIQLNPTLLPPELLAKYTITELTAAGAPFLLPGTRIEEMYWSCTGYQGNRKHANRRVPPFVVGKAPTCPHQFPWGYCGRYTHPEGSKTPVWRCTPENSDEHKSCGYYSLLRPEYEGKVPEETTSICFGCGRKTFKSIERANSLEVRDGR